MTSSRRHIFFLSSWYPNRMQPTLGNFVQKHAEAVALYHTVTALHVTSDPGLKTVYELNESLIRGVNTFNVYFKRSKNPLTNALRYFTAHKKGFRVIKEKFGVPALIHHNILYPAGIFALYLRRTKGLKYLVTENWTGYLPAHSHAYKGWFRKWLTKRIANKAALLTPVSENLSAAMHQHGFNAPHEVVYNVVDTRLFIPRKNPRVTFTFLHISTLVDDHKNITGILKAVLALSKQRSDFRFVIAGDGEVKPYEMLARTLGIEKLCEFGGEMSTAEVAERMQNADCFVLFSNYENLPCVMVEAMSAGLPVVASTVGGIPEHIQSWNGITVPPKDESALTLALQKILQEKDTFDANRIAAYASDQFSYEAVGKKFSAIYDKLLQKA